jgi:cold shock CspA family protein
MELQGQIVSYSQESKSGSIQGDDEEFYQFRRVDCKNLSKLKKGQKVKFLSSDSHNAVCIYLVDENGEYSLEGKIQEYLKVSQFGVIKGIDEQLYQFKSEDCIDIPNIQQGKKVKFKASGKNAILINLLDSLELEDADNKFSKNNTKPITELKDEINTTVLNLVLLTFATAGIYPIIWISKNYKIIDRITKKVTADDSFIIGIAVCFGWRDVIDMIDVFDVSNTRQIGLILNIASGILWVFWSFRVKKALEEYFLNEYRIDLRMNDFYTFIFTLYYIVYCINDLPEVERRQKILNKTLDS